MDVEKKFVSVDTICYMTYPCKHECTFTVGGNEVKQLYSGDDIANNYWDSLSDKEKEHFKYCRKPGLDCCIVN